MNIETLTKSNEAIIARWVADGLNINKKVDLDFYIHLQTKEACIEARALCRAKFKLPKDGLYVVISDGEGVALNINASMKLNAYTISEIELNLLEVADQFSNAEVTWEFKAPNP